MTINIALIGFGDVGSRKFVPALKEYASLALKKNYPLLKKNREITLYIVEIDEEKRRSAEDLSRECKEKNLSLKIVFLNPRVQKDKQVLHELLQEESFTLTYIASPNKTHAKYITEFLNASERIIVEKPLSDTTDDLRNLLDTDAPSKVRMMDHYLYKDAIKQFLEFYSTYLPINDLREIEFYLLEKGPISLSRSWLYESGVIRDLLPHFLSLLFKLFEKGVKIFDPEKIEIKNVFKAIYQRNAIPPHIKEVKETFASIELLMNNIPVKAVVGKGVPSDKKQFVFRGEEVTVVINTIENSIRSIRKGKVEMMYHRYVKKGHEYVYLMDDIFNMRWDEIGLSFYSAYKEVEIMEKMDAYPIVREYKLGTAPIPIEF